MQQAWRQVDDEQLFYLTSRGISEVEAKRLVIRGFLGAVIRSIPQALFKRTCRYD